VEYKYLAPLLPDDDVVLDGYSLGLGGMDVTILTGHGASEEFAMQRERVAVVSLVTLWVLRGRTLTGYKSGGKLLWRGVPWREF
jgi:hypothetical protein